MKGIEYLGLEVEDIITGFKGIVTEVNEYLHGCDRLAVRPRELKDGKPIGVQMFDQPQVKIINDKPIMEIPEIKTHVEFGQECKDPLSGFTGAVYGRALYMNGCSRVCLWPNNVTKDNKIETQWLDEPMVEVVELKPVVSRGNTRTGGPAHLGPSR